MKTETLFTLTPNDAQEILHKLAVMADSPDLQDDYGLSQGQANDLRDSVPQRGGSWVVPSWGESAVRAEVLDHCEVLDCIASNARSSREIGEALRISKQAKRLRHLVRSASTSRGIPTILE